jgi:adenylate cyclase
LEVVKQTMHTRWPLYVSSMLATNLFGALLVVLFIRHGIPLPEAVRRAAYHRTGPWILTAIILGAGALSLTGSAVMLRPVMQWQVRGGAPSQREQAAALHTPLRQAVVHLLLWILGGGVYLGLIYGETPDLVPVVSVTIAMAATVVFGFTYMLGERILRPVAAAALIEAPFGRTLTPGVWTRMGLTWGLGTMAPTMGIALLCVTQISAKLQFSTKSLAIAIILMCAIVISQALALSVLTSASISDPVQQLTRAIEKAHAGAVDVRVSVFDGSEIGQLQVGFNRMMDEAAKRRELQELFGRHVGEEVAQRALDVGTELGGETRFVAVLFVDMVGSTATAAERPPTEVVGMLNEFFRVVVEVVDRHHGFVNKFMGDAALVIFGAPLDRPDAPTAALAAARELRRELAAVVGLDIGIGVSAGLAVAGNIGAANRFEYTVIGDPVNEAARLTELAKEHPSRVLASSSALYFAEDEEHALWELGGEVRLRGRRRKTQLAWPAAAPGEPAIRLNGDSSSGTAREAGSPGSLG